MKTIDINTSLIEGYLRLLENLSPGSKLDLIARLSASVKADIAEPEHTFYRAFGAWEPADAGLQQPRESPNK